MSGKPDDDTDKSHEPTPHKLAEARKKGQIAKSADLTTAAAYGGFLLTALVAGEASVDALASLFKTLILQSGTLSELFFEGSQHVVSGAILSILAVGLSAWFILPTSTALASVFAQRSFIVTPSKLKPKLSRISLIQNARNKYGPTGLFEFFKNFAKLVLYSCLLAIFMIYRLPELAGSLHAEPAQIGALMARILVDFMCVVLGIALGIGAIDYIWHYFDHLRQNRMSHQELKEEFKQNEGDPHLKSERRQRAARVASEQMISDVKDAEVVIMNPTHFAVALKWSRMPGAAPVCVAKGVDHMAMTIRDVAMEHGVPVRQDAPTARALFASTEIGEEIDPSHYRAVAAAVRFAEAMRKRAKGL
ncbi:EscU/YscU/HrcU family type III secretion system export apparatus switch protein [Roseovarius rhodophyticola]|uniref:Flagellar type III secretion system protein FlhB n=1 Tax=Roseovarius rhodophyticola TaxID=3080827 RepID=A0ABZ2TIW8_9RHOB|nr:flagellar type III secretion system protein FlhB [Roseovarius sp. W115]MDV2929995.1 flagellar type III secretion system protein FlhB [Roseovarius sp. W115]